MVEFIKNEQAWYTPTSIIKREESEKKSFHTYVQTSKVVECYLANSNYKSKLNFEFVQLP